jgi:hypothetical protein
MLTGLFLIRAPALIRATVAGTSGASARMPAAMMGKTKPDKQHDEKKQRCDGVFHVPIIALQSP